MKFLPLIKGVVSEAHSAFQYKHLGKPWNVFAFVAMLPFIAAAWSLVAVYCATLFMFNAFASASDYLESWVKGEKQGIKHATEAVLYFVTMPTIFFLRVILSFFTISFYFTWFSLQIVAYIASLGGIKWQPFFAEATYDVKNVWKATTNNVAGIVFSLISFVLFVIVTILGIIGVAAAEDLEPEYYTVQLIFNLLFFAYCFLAVPITFRKTLLGVSGGNNAPVDVEEAEEEACDLDDLPEI